VSVLLDLVDHSDILLENWRPGVADRLGLGTGVLHGRNPRLIHVALSGYGLSGPWPMRVRSIRSCKASAASPGSTSTTTYPKGCASMSPTRWLRSTPSSPRSVRCCLREQGQLDQRIDLNMLDAFSYFNFPTCFISRTMVGEPDEDSIPRRSPVPRR